MLEDEFRLSDEICYLNHAAVSPWPQRTVAAVQAFAEENGRCGSRNYENWMQTELQLRRQLQQLINAASSDEIALLKNTSEALSVVAYGLDWQPGDEIVISSQEFPSNRIVWESLKPLGVTLIQVDIDPLSNPEQEIIDAITPATRLVSLSSVQYSSGLALDLVPIGAACKRYDVAFCVDAIQSIGALPFDVQACQADFVMADGHKWMLGPEGLALFYCRRDWIERLALKQYGWHMVEAMSDYDRRDWRPADSARRFECGSPNMLGIHALHASVGLLLETGLRQIHENISSNIQYLIDKLSENGATLLSSLVPEKRAGIVTFRFDGDDTAARFQYLKKNDVICALRGGGIRFSPHYYTSLPVLERALELLQDPI